MCIDDINAAEAPIKDAFDSFIEKFKSGYTPFQNVITHELMKNSHFTEGIASTNTFQASPMCTI